MLFPRIFFYFFAYLNIFWLLLLHAHNSSELSFIFARQSVYCHLYVTSVKKSSNYINNLSKYWMRVLSKKIRNCLHIAIYWRNNMISQKGIKTKLLYISLTSFSRNNLYSNHVVQDLSFGHICGINSSNDSQNYSKSQCRY